MFWFVVNRDCEVGGFVTPRFRYVPVVDVLFDLVGVLRCGVPMLHVPGVGRFVIDRDLRVFPRAFLYNADRCLVVGGLGSVVRACGLVGFCRLVRARGGFLAITNVARLDVIRFTHSIPINIIVNDFTF
ncbi:hypothetical protein [Vulcanisaeta thermophila]|uniref:hypothetical protein n=1 Tax=Vulcanisaeta thermophila TaxID=867917 RepID=UPI000853677E|nr:hypothetical protein [Vulcanisaeta thermophila]